MKNKVLLPLIILVIIAGAIWGYYYWYEKNKYSKTSLSPVEGLITVYYFDTGTYDEYNGLFFDKTKAVNLEVFNDYRKNNGPEVIFSKDKNISPNEYESVQSVMKHLKVENISDDQAKIFFLDDISLGDTAKSSSYWLTKKVNGRWYLD